MRQKPIDSQWTDAQWEAITADGSDILVAAAAGSGKTAVLVERIIQKIVNDNLSLDELLVVTFTNASAREMKERIHEAIQREAMKQPTDHLKTQLVKIHAAEISTLHSFCLKLIEQYYYTIDLDPAFRTASDEEVSLLLMQSLDEVMEQHYGTPDEDFLRTALHLSTDRHDQTLRQTIKQLYYFAIANPEPEQWLQRLSDNYSALSIDHPLFQRLTAVITDAVKSTAELLTEASLLLDGPAYEKHYLAVEPYARRLEGLSGDFEELYEQFMALDGLQIPAFRFSKSVEEMRHDELTEARIKQLLNEAKAQLESVRHDYFYAVPADMMADIEAMAAEVKTLTNLTQDLIVHFRQKKRERKILDFSDYEHLALQILMQHNEPTPIAEALKTRYKEILVDEYQDTNRVQETIVQLINNDHLFMVGDVKQSIYKFRQAEPGLFLEKYKRFNQTDDGIVIDLSRNFRSREPVIEDTNAVFRRLMDEEVGEISYDEKQQLYYGAPFDDNHTATELTVLVKDDIDTPAAESEWIAHKIKEIVQHEQVYDMKTGVYRPAEYRDIVVLERSFTQANDHQTIMKKYGIPFHVNSRTGYFQTDEIRTIMSLLRIIDNPLQDIHLVGILRSLLYQFDEVELVEIRLSNKDIYFFNNLTEYVEVHDNALSQKVTQFLTDLSLYREWARTLSVRQLLEAVYSRLFVVEKFAILTGGAQRRANLLGLLAKAEDFERSSYRGLYQFIRYVDNMLSEGKDFGEVNIVSEEADVVRMMTVHASKGLEFPFVIYAGLGREFNMMDLNGMVQLNQNLGLAISYYDPIRHLSYPTLMNHLFKHVARIEIISEEMRLMYVAFTRAKERLILLGKASRRNIESWTQVKLAGTLDERFRRGASSPLALIIGSVLNESAPLTDIQVQLVASLEQSAEIDQTEDAVLSAQTADWLNERMNYHYPFTQMNKLPTKESVSDIKRQTEVDDGATTWTLVNQYQLDRASYERPKFMTEKKRTAAERGTLMHTVMQHFPYQGHELSADELSQFLAQLIAKKIIGTEDIKEIDLEALVRYTRSPLYKMISESKAVYTELPFVIGKSYLTGEGLADAPMEQLVQGMIDCVFIYEGKYYFVDFKTDRFIARRGQSKAEVAEQLKQRYKIQMQFYKKALEEMVKEPVTGFLYFFEYQEVEV
ncbi:helicase-exonuclease AddAB subunit AddA [Macrococcus equipercicus]|uniref:ATP-dependent helicase/nuclease subunit A n=1 Tax=Macrococcus equipercicus TaxID=69967 RepID=A0A9Q9BW74_9STAP|nr:helicase-exonuclease AddAB subunit AddA [Macrococcus equipercicus]UTH14432.1 helicase-exonuclease AddAB subunit AddA [Macrococcus equipercicus]